jgi:UDP-glucose 4-epimerase
MNNGVVLVTGGAGYVGSICVEQLLEKGYAVVVLDNLEEGNREAVMPEAFFREGDFGDKLILEEIFKKFPVEFVFHFAAYASVPDSMIHPEKFYQNNLIKGLKLLEVMMKFDCKKMIFSSSAAIFGEPQYTPIDEKHPQNPISPYGDTKLAFERVLHWYHKSYGLRVNSFRYFNASGASEKLGEAHRHESHLIPLAILSATGKRQKLEVYGNDYETKDGTCVRDYVHVVDIADAHTCAIGNLDVNPYAFYNLGCGSGYTVDEVIMTIQTVSGLNVPFEYVGRRAGDPAILVADNRLAKKELGWKPLHNIQQIVESAWNWYRAHPDGYQH